MQFFQYTPTSEIDARIKKLQADMPAVGCGGVIITHHTNLYYYTGTSQSGHLFVPRAGAPLLMIRKSLARARQESPIEKVVPLTSLKKMPALIRETGACLPSVIGFELGVIPYNTVLFYQKIFESAEFVNVSGVVRNLRRIKSPHEIELLSSACAVLDAAFARVPGMLREGMTEIELASLFEAELRKGGYGGSSKMHAFNSDYFMGTLVSGTSGAVGTFIDGPVGGTGLTPANNPHGAGWKKIQRNETILIDYSCILHGYTADETRMFVMGEPSETIRNAHQAARSIQKELVAMALPGIPSQDIYARGASLAEEMGLSEHFMGMGDSQVRFVGHGVGLELDELPVFASGMKMPLEPGMTFALEPKFVFPEGAVGIENVYVMTGDGARPLTHSEEEIVCVP